MARIDKDLEGFFQDSYEWFENGVGFERIPSRFFRIFEDPFKRVQDFRQSISRF